MKEKKRNEKQKKEMGFNKRSAIYNKIEQFIFLQKRERRKKIQYKILAQKKQTERNYLFYTKM